MRKPALSIAAAFFAAFCCAAIAAAQPIGAGVRLASPTIVNHAPTLAALASKTLLLCWYGGRAEANRDVSIFCTASADSGASWSAPRVAVKPRETAAGVRGVTKSLGNPTLFQEHGGRVWLIYGLVQARPKSLINLCRSWRCGRIDAKYSDDDGATWSAPQRLVDQAGALPRARPLATANGALLPLYLERAQTSFLADATIRDGVIQIAPGAPMIGPNLIQPSIVPADATHVRAYFRDRRGRHIYTALYDVPAQRWGAPTPLALPNPDSAVEAVRRADGAIALIYNPETNNRRALALALSADGLAFPHLCTIVDGAGDVAYPSALFAPNGDLLIAFSAHGKREIRFLRLSRAAQAQCFAG
ncbi:MAG: exo-alpha-sialidase [Alphaproteobacteria bacterium]